MLSDTSQYNDDESKELVSRFEQSLNGSAPGYFDVHEMEKIVDFYLWSGRTKDSLKALELGKKLHPLSDQIEMKRAKVYLTTGDAKKAYRILSNLIESNDLEISLLKVETFIKLNRISEAYQIAIDLLEENPNDADTIGLDLASFFSMERHLPEALKILKLTNEIVPSNIEVLQELAYVQENLGLSEEAIATDNQIIDIKPYTEEAWYHLGQIYTSQKDYEKAIEAFDFVLAIDESNKMANFNKAFVLTALSRWEDAIESYLTFSDFTDEKWQIWLLIADCYENLENYTEALKYYQLSYSEHTDDNFSALLGICINLLNLNDYKEVFKYIDTAITLNEESFEAWVIKGEAHEGLFEYEKALKCYQQAVSIEPNLPDALKSMANIYMDKMDFPMALKYYELAYGFDNTLEYIELFLAVANYYTANFDDMIKFLELAVQRNLDAAELFLELCPGVDVELNKMKK